MSEVFPNKNPILFGEAEDSEGIIDTPAVAGLTGSVVLAKDTDQGVDELAGTSQFSPNEQPRLTSGIDGNEKITWPNVITPADSILVIVVSTASPVANSASTKNWLITEDTVTKFSFTQSATNSNQTRSEMNVFTDASPSAGTHDYAVEEDDGNSYGAISATLFFIKATDTHGAIISTPATATKQINSPDSHTTRQTEVIP